MNSDQLTKVTQTIKNYIDSKALGQGSGGGVITETRDIQITSTGTLNLSEQITAQTATVEYTLSTNPSISTGSGLSFTNIIGSTPVPMQRNNANITTIDEGTCEQSSTPVNVEKDMYFRYMISANILTVGHKYYGSVYAKSVGSGYNMKVLDTYISITTEYTRYSAITEQTVGTLYIGISDPVTANDAIYMKKPLLIDLTELYGAGNEPTLQQFETTLGDAWAFDTYTGTGGGTEGGGTEGTPSHFQMTSYNSSNEAIDTFDSANSDTTIDIIGGGHIVVTCAGTFPSVLKLKNVVHRTTQTGNTGSNTGTTSTREFEGIKWACIGDSLTDSTINANRKYHQIIAEKTGITVQELAKGGTGYTAGYDSNNTFYDRIALINSDTDIVTLFGSVNDWKNNAHNTLCPEIGTVNDVYDDNRTVIENTFCANLNKTFDALFAKVPTAQVIVFGAMPYYGVNDTYFDNVRKALIDVCAKRHIPYVDMFDATGFYRIMDNSAYATAYTTDFTGTNYDTQTSFGHPNNDAHLKIIAPIFLAELRKHLPGNLA